MDNFSTLDLCIQQRLAVTSPLKSHTCLRACITQHMPCFMTSTVIEGSLPTSKAKLSRHPRSAKRESNQFSSTLQRWESASVSVSLKLPTDLQESLRAGTAPAVIACSLLQQAGW